MEKNVEYPPYIPYFSAHYFVYGVFILYLGHFRLRLNALAPFLYDGRIFVYLFRNYLTEVVFLSITSWYPPSTILVELTTVSLAFFCSSGMVMAPQLHIVAFTL